MNKKFEISESREIDLSLLEGDKSRFQKFIGLFKQPFSRFFEKNVDLDEVDNEEPVNEFLLRRQELENEKIVEEKESIDEINQKKVLIHIELSDLYDSSENFKVFLISSREVFLKEENKNYIDHVHLDKIIDRMIRLMKKREIQPLEIDEYLNFIEYFFNTEMIKSFIPSELMRIYYTLRMFDDEKSQKITKTLDLNISNGKYLNARSMSELFYPLQFLKKGELSDDFFKDVINILSKSNIDFIDIMSLALTLYGLFDFKNQEHAKIMVKVFFEYFERNTLKKLKGLNLLTENNRSKIRTMRQVYAIYNRPVPEELGTLFLECSNVRIQTKEQNALEEKIFKAIKCKLKNFKNIDVTWGSHEFGFECDVLIIGDGWKINIETDGKHHYNVQKNIIHDKRRDEVFKREDISVFRFRLGGAYGLKNLNNFLENIKSTVESEGKKIWEEKKKAREEKLLAKKEASIEASNVKSGFEDAVE